MKNDTKSQFILRHSSIVLGRSIWSALLLVFALLFAGARGAEGAAPANPTITGPKYYKSSSGGSRPTYTAPEFEISSDNSAVVAFVDGSNNDNTGWEVVDNPSVWTGHNDFHYTGPVTSPEGFHALFAKVRNSANEWSDSVQHTYYIDNTAPTISSLSCDTGTGDSTPTFSWTRTIGSYDGEGATRVYIDGVKCHSGDLADNVQTYTHTTELATDSYTFKVEAEDEAGNVASSEITFSIIVGKPTDPVFNAVTSPTRDTTPSWSWSSVGATKYDIVLKKGSTQIESKTGQTSTSYTAPDLSTHGDGAYTLYVTAVNADGSSAQKAKSRTLDTTGPSAAPSMNVPALTKTKQPTFTITRGSSDTITCLVDWSNKDSTSWEGPYTFNPSSGQVTIQAPRSYSDNEHNIYVVGYDSAGNVSSSRKYTMRVDTTAFTMSDFQCTTPQNDNTPTFTWSRSGVNAWDSPLYHELTAASGSIGDVLTYTRTTAFADGWHTVTLKGYDAAGNAASEQSITINIETQPPTAPGVTWITPANDRTPGFSLTWPSDATHFKYRKSWSTTWKEKSTMWSTIYYNDDVLNDGTYWTEFVAIDAAGNESGATRETFTIDATPPTAPTITRTKIDGSTPASDGTGAQRFTWNLPSGATYTTFVLKKGSTTINGYTSGSYWASYPSLASGTYTFKVTAWDAAGNSKSSSITFTLDFTVVAQPNTTFTGMSNGKPTFSLGLPSDAVAYKYSLNNVSFTTVNSKDSTLSISGLSDGDKDLYIYAKGANGLWSTPVKHVPFTVDASGPVAPTVVCMDCNDSSPWHSLSWASDVVSFRYRKSWETGQPWHTKSSPYTGIYFNDANLTGDGTTHWVEFQGRDAAGNWGTVERNTFTLDFTEPNDFDYPDRTSSGTDNTPTFTWDYDGVDISYVKAKMAFPNGTDTGYYDISPTIAGVKATYTYTTPLGVGAHTFYVRHYDECGNFRGKGVNFDIYSSPPAKPSNITGPALTKDATPTFSWTIDAVKTKVIQLEEGGNVVDLGKVTSYTFPNALSDGTHWFRIRAGEGNGGWSDWVRSDDFRIDTTPVSHTSTAGDPYNLEITTSQDDNTPTFFHNFRYWTHDKPVWARLEIYQGATRKHRIDYQDPDQLTTEITVPDNKALPNGNYTAKWWHYDAAGNATAVHTLPFTINFVPPTAPSVTLLSAAGAETPEFQVTMPNPRGSATKWRYRWSASDAWVTWSINNNVETLGHWGAPVGEHTFEAQCGDRFGNFSASATQPYNVGLDNPYKPLRLSVAYDRTPTFGFGGVPNGATRFSFSVDGGNFIERTVSADPDPTARQWTSGALTIGQHTLAVKQADAAGNWSEASDELEFTISKTPQPTGLERRPNNASGKPVFRWSRTIKDTGSMSYQIKWGNGSWEDVTPVKDGTWHLLWTDTTPPTSDKTLYVRQAASPNNWSDSSAGLPCTLTPPAAPTVTLLSAAGAQNPEFQVTMPNPRGSATKWRYRWSAGADWSSLKDIVQNVEALTYWGAPIGSHTFEAQCGDAYGNFSASATQPYSVGAPAPSKPLRLSTPQDATPTFGFGGVFAGISRFSFNLDGTGWQEKTVSADPDPTARQWTSGTLAVGEHTLAVKQADAAGNWSVSSDTLEFTITRTPPPDALEELTSTTSWPLFKFSRGFVTDEAMDYQAQWDSGAWQTITPTKNGSWELHWEAVNPPNATELRFRQKLASATEYSDPSDALDVLTGPAYRPTVTLLSAPGAQEAQFEVTMPNPRGPITKYRYKLHDAGAWDVNTIVNDVETVSHWPGFGEYTFHVQCGYLNTWSAGPTVDYYRVPPAPFNLFNESQPSETQPLIKFDYHPDYNPDGFRYKVDNGSWVDITDRVYRRGWDDPDEYVFRTDPLAPGSTYELTIQQRINGAWSPDSNPIDITVTTSPVTVTYTSTSGDCTPNFTVRTTLTDVDYMNLSLCKMGDYGPECEYKTLNNPEANVDIPIEYAYPWQPPCIGPGTYWLDVGLYSDSVGGMTFESILENIVVVEPVPKPTTPALESGNYDATPEFAWCNSPEDVSFFQANLDGAGFVDITVSTDPTATCRRWIVPDEDALTVEEHTLQIQQSHDGVNWSEASETLEFNIDKTRKPDALARLTSTTSWPLFKFSRGFTTSEAMNYQAQWDNGAWTTITPTKNGSWELHWEAVNPPVSATTLRFRQKFASATTYSDASDALPVVLTPPAPPTVTLLSAAGDSSPEFQVTMPNPRGTATKWRYRWDSSDDWSHAMTIVRDVETLTYWNAPVGQHTFEAQCCDDDGNFSASATQTYYIVPNQPDVPERVTAPDDLTPEFRWCGSDGFSYFQANLDGDGFVDISADVVVDADPDCRRWTAADALAWDSHTFQVRQSYDGNYWSDPSDVCEFDLGDPACAVTVSEVANGNYPWLRIENAHTDGEKYRICIYSDSAESVLLGEYTVNREGDSQLWQWPNPSRKEALSDADLIFARAHLVLNDLTECGSGATDSGVSVHAKVVADVLSAHSSDALTLGLTWSEANGLAERVEVSVDSDTTWASIPNDVTEYDYGDVGFGEHTVRFKVYASGDHVVDEFELTYTSTDPTPGEPVPDDPAYVQTCDGVRLLGTIDAFSELLVDNQSVGIFPEPTGTVTPGMEINGPEIALNGNGAQTDAIEFQSASAQTVLIRMRANDGQPVSASLMTQQGDAYSLAETGIYSLDLPAGLHRVEYIDGDALLQFATPEQSFDVEIARASGTHDLTLLATSEYGSSDPVYVQVVSSAGEETPTFDITGAPDFADLTGFSLGIADQTLECLSGTYGIALDSAEQPVTERTLTADGNGQYTVSLSSMTPGNYYFRVFLDADDGQKYYSDAYAVGLYNTCGAMSGTATPPADAERGVPMTFTWPTAANAAEYIFMLSDAPFALAAGPQPPASGVKLVQTLSAATATITEQDLVTAGLDAAPTLYWNVVARNPRNSVSLFGSAAGNARSLTRGLPPIDPVPADPAYVSTCAGVNLLGHVPANCKLVVDGTEHGPFAPANQGDTYAAYTAPVAMAADGSRNFVLVARNDNGDSGNVTVPVYRNTAPPYLTLTPTVNADQSVTLSWAGYGAICNYADTKIYYSIAAFTDLADATLLDTLTSEATKSYTTDPLPGGMHSFVVVVSDSDGRYSPYARQDVLVMDTTVPAAVALSVSDAGQQKALLSWTGYTPSFDFERYEVYHANATFSDPADATLVTTINEGTTKTFTTDTLTAGTHYFAVYAYDSSQNRSPSAASSVTIADVFDPSAPGNLAGTPEQNQVVLSWTAAPDTYGDLAGYKVRRDGDPTVEDVTGTTFTWTGLSPAVNYTFRVTAWDGANESAEISASIETLLPVVTGLSASAIGEDSVTLSWTGVTPADKVSQYRIYAANAAFTSIAGKTPIATVSGATTRDLTGLTKGQTYYFAVAAANQAGAVDKDVTTVQVDLLRDNDNPTVASPQWEGVALISGQNVSESGTLSVEASDASGVAQVIFYADNVEIGRDSVADASGRYTCTWNIAGKTPKTYTLKAEAADTFGNKASWSDTVTLVIPAPTLAPTITSPVADAEFTVNSITVSGTYAGSKDDKVAVYVGGVEKTKVAVSSAGAFSATGIGLAEGDNNLSAKAVNTTGTGPESTVVKVTVDTLTPQAPRNLSLELLSGGSVQVSWMKPLGIAVDGYRLYRAEGEFADKSQAQLLNASVLIPGTSQIDEPGDSPSFYYAVSAVKDGVEGPLCTAVKIDMDNEAPSAMWISFASAADNGAVNDGNGTYGPGVVDIGVEVSEELQAVPQLTLTWPDGSKRGVTLSAGSTMLKYKGTLTLTATTPQGTPTVSFSATDLAGNVGTVVSGKDDFSVDTVGPSISEVVLVNPDTAPIQN